EDVILLARRFLERAAAAIGAPPPTIAPELAERLRRHPWPGNVRELLNACSYAVRVAGAASVVEPRHWPIAEAAEGIPRFGLHADDVYDTLDPCTPNFQHPPMAISAIDAGKHMLCERPLARSSDEARAMAKAAKKADRVLMCAVQHRFRPDAQLLRKVVEKGELGPLFYAKAGWLRQRTEWDSDEWRRQKRESGGGVVLDLGFQMLDLALWVLGNPSVTSVNASVHRLRKDEVEDSATALLRLENGATLTLELTWGLLMEKD